MRSVTRYFFHALSAALLMFCLTAASSCNKKPQLSSITDISGTVWTTDSGDRNMFIAKYQDGAPCGKVGICTYDNPNGTRDVIYYDASENLMLSTDQVPVALGHYFYFNPYLV